MDEVDDVDEVTSGTVELVVEVGGVGDPGNTLGPVEDRAPRQQLLFESADQKLHVDGINGDGTVILIRQPGNLNAALT